MRGALLALAAAAAAQDVPRPTRLRIYEVRTALRFDEGRRADTHHAAPSKPVPRTVNGTGHTDPSEFCATSI